MSRFLNSGRFGYAMGFKSKEAAYEALYNMCNSGELTENEAEIESYNISGTPHKRITRWAITTE